MAATAVILAAFDFGPNTRFSPLHIGKRKRGKFTKRTPAGTVFHELLLLMP
jgi:hypothetical protein